MKTIIAGSRSICNMQLLYEALDEWCPWPVDEVVSGCAKGVDSLGIRWAETWKIPIHKFPADWSLGKHAGILRNQQMADFADNCLLLWDGKSKGTLNMLQEMQKRSKPVAVWVVPYDCIS